MTMITDKKMNTHHNHEGDVDGVFRNQKEQHPAFLNVLRLQWNHSLTSPPVGLQRAEGD